MSAVALASGLAFGIALPVAAAPVALTSVMGSPVEGTWRTQNGTEITIAPCDEGFCGTLSHVVVPVKQAPMCKTMDKVQFGALLLDYKNPDKSLQTRSLLGMQMLTVKPTSDPTSFTASVYNAEDGSTNSAQVFIMNNGATLRIGGGCIGTMCVQSQDWPKEPARENTPDFTCQG